MTAAELYEVVKDVPREAWPELTWDGVEWSNSRRDEDVSARIAEHAFIGSMTAWLAGGMWINHRTHTDGEMIYKVKASDGGRSVYGDHRNLVAALAAACKEAA